MDIAIKNNKITGLKIRWNAAWLPIIVACLTIVLACIMVMLPRIQSPQFGLLDDGSTLVMVKSITKDPSIAFTFMAKSGRFLPGFWLFVTLLYNIFGAFARKWFFIYLFILTFESLGIYWLVRMRGFSNWQAWAAGLLFCISSPIIENFYTLSKPEILVVGWLILALIAFGLSTRTNSRIVQISLLFLTFISILFSFFSKEVAVVTIGIFASWAVLARIFPSAPGDFLNKKNSLYLFLLSLLVGLVYFLLHNYYIPFGIQEGSYTSNYRLDLAVISRQLVNWAGFFLRNFLYLVPLVFLLAVPSIRKPGLIKGVLEHAAWMSAWIIIFLPWRMIQEYFVLPLSFGCAILGGLLIGRALESILSNAVPSISRIASALLFALSLFFLQLTIPNIVTNARTQLLYDKENANMLKSISRLPENAHLLVNFPYKVEYTAQLKMLLRALRGREDIQFEPFRFQGNLPEDPVEYYVLTPQFVNQTLPSVRNSLYESGVSEWNKSLITYLNGNGEVYYSQAGDLKLFDIGMHRLLIPLGGTDIMGSVDRPFVDTRTLTYGWSIYHIKINSSNQQQPGWYTEDGTWLLRVKEGIKQVQMAGEQDDIPLAGDINGDGWTDLGFYRPAERKFLFDTNLDGKTDLSQNINKMQPGDVPLLGDWDGDGADSPAFYRPETSQWFFGDLNNSLDVVKPIVFGSGYMVPVAGDWNGDGRDEYGIYRPDSGEVALALDFLPVIQNILSYGSGENMVPVAGDWHGFGKDSLAFIKDGQWCFRPYNNTGTPPNEGECLEWQTGPGTPVSGRWR